MRLSTIPFLFWIAAAGCSSEPSEYRALLCGTTDRFCPPADECIAAIREADCEGLRLRAVEVESDAFRSCIARCPLVRPCGDDVAETAIECNCFADCVESEPPESQAAALDYLECATPPECR